MAERSKACDSSESLPAFAGFSSGYPGVGSNPTLVMVLPISSTAEVVARVSISSAIEAHTLEWSRIQMC